MARTSSFDALKNGDLHMFQKFAVVGLVACLTACAAPINTSSAPNSQIAGRCKLLAYKEDQSSYARGLISMAIVQANKDARRQEIYDACVAAGGSREVVPEIYP
jgi:hypothetical protein